MILKKRQILLTTFVLASLLFVLQLFQVSAQAEFEGDIAAEKTVKEYKNNKGFLERNYGNGIIMVYIPSGRFKMGALTIGSYPNIRQETPSRDVDLDGYWIGKYEVTLAQYKAFVTDTGYQALPSYTSEYAPGENHPVLGVSWEDAVAYCKWLSRKMGVRFKLPTEAQWEKAARGTDENIYPWGDKEPDKTLANFASHVGKSVPVGSYPGGVSHYGLWDMAGNVWEWCQDWYDGNYYPAAPRDNPPGPPSGISRVMRGGCWSSGGIFLRCAARNGVAPSFRGIIVGFRLSLDEG